MKQYLIPENLLHATIVHMSHSIPKLATTDESNQLLNALKQLSEFNPEEKSTSETKE